MESGGLQRKYGLFTAIAMVVGIVIGSGIFFKTETILAVAGGKVTVGILSIVILGAVMLICSYAFSILAAKYEKVNGVVDYAEATCGAGYGYYIGWFMAAAYYPAMTSVVVWVAGRYTSALLGLSDPVNGGSTLVIACFYLCVLYGLNTLAPRLAGRFQVSTTVIKLIPLVLMAVVGTVLGLRSGNLAANFSGSGGAAATELSTGAALLAGCVAMTFSYEGWIITASINAELKDAKRNLPIALLTGAAVVVLVYVCYYLGINGAISTEALLERGSAQAFVNIFGNVGGSVLSAFIIISCLGTANGLMLGCVRGMYALAVRGEGPRPEVFRQVDRATNMPVNSCVFGLLVCAAWLLYFYGGNLAEPLWFGRFGFDSSELPIVTIYALYIPIFVRFMQRERGLGGFKRFVVPCAAIVCCLFLMTAACIAHGVRVLYYLVLFALIMALGALLRKSKSQR